LTGILITVSDTSRKAGGPTAPRLIKPGSAELCPQAARRSGAVFSCEVSGGAPRRVAFRPAPASVRGGESPIERCCLLSCGAENRGAKRLP
jgi:hypothetical protein